MLTIVAELALVAAVLLYAGRTAIDALRPPPPPPPSPRVGGMVWSSFANNNGAHFAFTNLTPDVRVACVKGIVTAMQSKISIESLVVCSGEVKPNTTVTVDATWPKGSPEDICNKETSFGKTLDWSKCEFTHVDVAPAVATPPGAPAASASSSSASTR